MKKFFQLYPFHHNRANNSEVPGRKCVQTGTNCVHGLLFKWGDR